MPTPKAPSLATLAHLSNALSAFRLTTLTPTSTFTAIRHASHQAQGRANGAKDGAGKRLGAKKTGGEYVIPGNILFKQRGTHWFPGDNCFMGRDHTIHAGLPGYVRYYRDPLRHPKRKYIGIVFEKEQVLPQPPHAARRRMLGMLAYQAPTPPPPTPTPELPSPSSIPSSKAKDATSVTLPPTKRNPTGLHLELSQGYQYRQTNFEIGLSGDKKEEHALLRGKTTRAFADYKKGDRFAAWRKRALRVARGRERGVMGRGGKKGGKKGVN
ncbi:54S ribosomal protein L2 mitochondrial [Elasticomyces elasticus]|uniref:Large ribosomal subunit protein bL27m n=1 Tax=Elasticomyces elasticus TaxID=574655 RepID=A0AAN7W549_9PEZI|nr:54S ribosomal protein L2 mitochondrial [Elasticomyces elasticus]